jgi:hypothetical protein
LYHYLIISSVILSIFYPLSSARQCSINEMGKGCKININRTMKKWARAKRVRICFSCTKIKGLSSSIHRDSMDSKNSSLETIDSIDSNDTIHMIDENTTIRQEMLPFLNFHKFITVTYLRQKYQDKKSLHSKKRRTWNGYGPRYEISKYEIFVMKPRNFLILWQKVLSRKNFEFT